MNTTKLIKDLDKKLSRMFAAEYGTLKRDALSASCEEAICLLAEQGLGAVLVHTNAGRLAWLDLETMGFN